MKRVRITEAGSGQVVARPVATSSGLVMVQPGATLTDEIVSRLANLGVDAVWVEGTADDAKPLDQLLAELEGRFAGHDNDLLMRELKAVVADCIRQGAADTRD